MKTPELISIARKCGERTTDCRAICPFYNQPDCTILLINTLAGKVQSQRRIIEKYTKEHDENFDKWNILAERTKKRYAELYQEAKAVVRAKAIKEFEVEIRMRKTTVYGIPVYLIEPVILDNLVKELIDTDNET